MGFLVQNKLNPGFVSASYYILSNLCHFISTSTLRLILSPTVGIKPCQEKLPLLFKVCNNTTHFKPFFPPFLGNFCPWVELNHIASFNLNGIYVLQLKLTLDVP